MIDAHPRAGRHLRPATLAALLALLSACGPSQPSVLVVSIDTLRADVAAESMPRLAALAARGTRFSRASANTPLTLPSHASLLTGCRPSRHGLTVNGLAVPSLPTSTLAEALSAQGFATAAFVSAAVLDRRHGLDRGFAHYDDELATPDGPAVAHERRGDHTVDRVLRWLDEQQAPWFAFVHLYDPHAPYAAPDGVREPPAAAYRDEVSFADRQLGRLLDALAGQDVLIVVTSDHGEGLGEHGEQTHGLLLHEATLHVPLVMAWTGAGHDAPPGGTGERVDAVSLLDVAPTILELVGRDPDAGARDGRSIVRSGAPRPIPLEARAGWFYYGFSPLAGVRLGERKLVGAPQADPPRWELFDLATDAAERAPAAGAGADLLALVRDTAPAREAAPIADAGSLRALGYLGADPPPEHGGARADPRDAMPLIDAIDRAHTALASGDPRGALAALEPFADDWADVAELQLFVGKAQRALGHGELAAAALRRAVALQPASVGALQELAKVLMERATAGAADPGESLELLRQAAALVPADLETLALRALHDVVFGDPAEALERLAPALARQPHVKALRVVERRAREALHAAGR